MIPFIRFFSETKLWNSCVVYAGVFPDLHSPDGSFNIRSSLSSSSEEEEEEEQLSLVRPSIALSKLDIEVLVFIRLFQGSSRALKSVHFFRIAYCAQVEMLLLLLFFS
jgi:hypothetical protein